jgi:hypothetical protein
MLDEMECDNLASNGMYLLTRIGNGEAMLVWRLLPSGGVGEMPVNEVELNADDRLDISKSLAFHMKSIVNSSSEQDKEELVMVHIYADYVKFNLLT